MPAPIALDASLFDIMYHCRSMRRFTTEPVPEDVLRALVDAALQAPSGSNAQHWAFVVVRESARKRELQALWRRSWAFYRAAFSDIPLRPHEDAAARARTLRAADHLAEHLHEVPALIFVALRRDDAFMDALSSPRALRLAARLLGLGATLRLLAAGPRTAALADGASAYPAVQNLLLAARAHGLGAVVTTQHFFLPGAFERVIGLPAHATLAAIVPVGYPLGRFGPVSRPPATDVLAWERWPHSA